MRNFDIGRILGAKFVTEEEGLRDGDATKSILGDQDLGTE